MSCESISFESVTLTIYNVGFYSNICFLCLPWADVGISFTGFYSTEFDTLDDSSSVFSLQHFQMIKRPSAYKPNAPKNHPNVIPTIVP